MGQNTAVCVVAGTHQIDLVGPLISCLTQFANLFSGTIESTTFVKAREALGSGPLKNRVEGGDYSNTIPRIALLLSYGQQVLTYLKQATWVSMEVASPTGLLKLGKRVSHWALCISISTSLANHTKM